MQLFSTHTLATACILTFVCQGVDAGGYLWSCIDSNVPSGLQLYASCNNKETLPVEKWVPVEFDLNLCLTNDAGNLVVSAFSSFLDFAFTVLFFFLFSTYVHFNNSPG